MFDTLPKNAVDALDWTPEQYQPYFDDLLARDLNADNVSTWMADWSAVAKLASEVGARVNVATTVDTTDEKAIERYNRFYEDLLPVMLKADDALNRKLVESGVQPENFEVPLQKIKADMELFREENLPLFTEISKLSLEYDQIIGAQTVTWEGEERTLAQMQPLFQEADREMRERAWRLSMARRLQDRDTLDDLWTRFMHVRGKIAANADMPDFRAYQWKSMHRFDYTPADSETFQRAIEEVVVPAAARLYEKRRQRLSVPTLRPWDTDVDPSGQPPLRPYTTIDELEGKAEAMFTRLDPALGGYFRTMRDEKLLDLDNRKGKAPGGYCTDFALAERPFIFMNAVGLHDDVQTLLHEGGHAFHAFESYNLPYAQQLNVPTEFAEVASMAMELLAAPYLTAESGGYYTESEAARARVEHLSGSLQFWPYMAVVDAFQHWVYTNHTAATDPANCDAKWGELWDRFMVGIDYDGLDDIRVTGWQRKLHIYQIPFYYIEYGLAQLGAVQVWARSLENPTQATADYRKALALGGTRSLPELFAAAGVKFAFDAATLHRAVDLIESTINALEVVG